MSVPSPWLALLTIAGLTTATAHAQRTDSLAFQVPTLFRITDSAAAARPASHLSAESKVDRPVRVRYCPEPISPKTLVLYGFTEQVVLTFVVDTLGRPEMDDLVVSEGSSPALIHLARRTVARCRYDPARKSGRPVRHLVQQCIRFLPGPKQE